MSVIWTIISFIIIFSVLVVVHEFGHFIVAKANGIHVKEFGVGMGPKLLGFTKNGTDYVLRALPFGGACVFDEDDPFEDEEDEAKKEENPLEETENQYGGKFSDASLAGRIATVLAGPVFNIILGFILALIIVGTCGEYDCTVGEVLDDFPAKEAGIQAGDKIISINGERVYLFSEISLHSIADKSDDWVVKYERDGEIHEVKVTIKAADGGKYLGVMPADKVNCANIKIFEYSWYEVRYWFVATFKSFGMLFAGRLTKDDIAGPVGMAHVIGEMIKETSQYGVLTVIINLVDIAMLLSVNLAIMNLLPFPALDGGRLVFLIAELIIRRKVPRKFEAVVTLVGFGALLLLMIFVLVNDVSRFFR